MEEGIGGKGREGSRCGMSGEKKKEDKLMQGRILGQARARRWIETGRGGGAGGAKKQGIMGV